MDERVLIADDDGTVRRIIRAALEHAGFEVCGEASDADEAIQLALQMAPDVCLLDVYMPSSGIHAAEEISRQLPGTKVVMLTSSAHDQDLLDALGAGARGYLPKKMNTRLLRDTLEKVIQGDLVMPPKLVAKAIRGGGTAGGRLVELPDGQRVELTEWELALLDMVADGRGEDEIAERHSRSSSEVSGAVASILGRLEVPDAIAAVRLLARPDD